MKARSWMVVGLLMAIATAWYLFRPELLFIDRVVNEAAPAASRSASAATSAMKQEILARGMFHSVAHETHGAAAILRLADGRRVLRVTDFSTSNGPDVRVLLVAAADANDSASVTASASLELGPLKGNKGDQNYILPDDVDLDRYGAVTIWCHRFSVNFGTAPLEPQAG